MVEVVKTIPEKVIISVGAVVEFLKFFELGVKLFVKDHFFVVGLVEIFQLASEFIN
jgi:hypothetical protein